ncbi:AAA family ATPase [Oceanobacillus sp. M65]|uniref:AAA family ATPase n=1 Tax=Oceanobacillus sp. M65 TaxID=3457435 RepID=UPI003FCCB354
MIGIEKMVIYNYRKFCCETISLNDEVTAIAGANNSGKTSLVELMSNIFTKDKRDTIRIEDMNSKVRLRDEVTLENIIKNESLKKDDKIEKLLAIHKKLNKIKIHLTIKYNDSDNLENFSRYLADVDITKRNFYFVIEFEYTPTKEEDIIDILNNEADFKEVYAYLQSKIYYCDESFENKVQITDRSDFINLFNYHSVYAIRKLSDTSEEKQNYLSKHLLKTVQNNVQWKDNLKILIKNINQLLRKQNLSNEIDTITLHHVESTLESFSKTNGGNAGKLGIDFRLENGDIEKVLLDFIHIYFEQEEGLRIKEQKQGLGYSNLIYLLLEGQIFSQKIDEKKVNLLLFEEPEAHLHPQMENIFIRYISAINSSTEESEKTTEVTEEVAGLTEVAAGLAEVAAVIEEDSTKTEVEKEDSNEANEQKASPFQMVITTHSSEMAKTISLSNVRVLRSNGHTESKVFDLQTFMSLPKIDRNFYNKFFQFNMIEMIFADKLILFEGDAERLLLKYLISNIQKYEELSSQYISYIQVGGAYAYKYLDLINFLEIKTLIFTDIDYEYKKEDNEKEPDLILEEIQNRETSNYTLRKFIGESVISEIYKEVKTTPDKLLLNANVHLKFQTYADGYARTLEDAILHKLLDYETVFSKITKEELKLIIEDKNLIMSNTTKTKTSLRDRVDKLNNKTDFMYSLIESGNINNAIPNYIEEGLNWLKD